MKIYTLARVKSALVHFLMGKSFSALFGIAIALVLVREMTVADYAAYAVLLGVDLLVGSISSLAIDPASQRFLPEMLVKREYQRLFSLTCIAVIARTFALLLVILVFYIFGGGIVDFFSLPDAGNVFTWWLVAIFFMILFRFVNTLQQIFLQHKILKWIGIGLNMTRLSSVLVLVFMYQAISLEEVIWIEIGSYSLFVILSLFYLFNGLLSLTENKRYPISISDIDKRIINFIKVMSVRDFVTIFSGNAMNRLIVGKFLNISAIGAFGFSQSMVGIVGRYMPSKLLNNMIMPVLMGKYAEKRDINQLVKMGDFVFRLNLCVILPVMFLMLLLGESGSEYVTKGKYPDAAYYLAGLTAILVLQSHMYFLQLVATGAEVVKPLLHGTVLLALFIVPIGFLVVSYGVWGLIAGKLFGAFTRNIYIVKYLKKESIHCKTDMGTNAKLLLCALLPYAALMMVDVKLNNLVSLSGIVAGYASIYLAALYLLRPVNASEMKLLKKLSSRKAA